MTLVALPRSLDDLRGLRVARWIRESSKKQGDRYGPDAQRAMQNRAIDELGMVDTGLAWLVLKSGWSGPDSMLEPPATRTADFRQMLAAAEAGAYDVLLVGYSSRFIRDLTLALHYRRWFAHHGVAIYLADDRILSSDPRDWERFAEKAKAAEVYSRDLSRNIRSGYAAMRAAGQPGGRPPFGFQRVGDPPLLVPDRSRMPIVERAFVLAAGGATDLAVATETGLTVHTVRSVLVNAIYVGRLSDGSRAAVEPAIDAATWERVRQQRERRRTRVPGRPVRRGYALKLRCAACARALFGQHGRYRHPHPTCPEFLAAAPRRRRAFKNALDRRVKGHSYPMAWYEGAISLLLEEAAALDTTTIAAVVERYRADPVQVDEMAIGRIARERDEATRRLGRDRDVDRWQAAMARLDAEEAAARRPVERRPLTAEEVRRYLSELPALWADAPASRQALAATLFDRLAVLGASRLEYVWSRDAIDHGLGVAVPGTLDIGARLVDLVGARGAGPTELIDRTPAERRIVEIRRSA